jgi:hypothetical protein
MGGASLKKTCDDHGSRNFAGPEMLKTVDQQFLFLRELNGRGRPDLRRSQDTHLRYYRSARWPIEYSDVGGAVQEVQMDEFWKRDLPMLGRFRHLSFCLS